MRKPFVVISGLPGSGKTTLGRRLSPVLELPLIDKDDILDRLLASKGIGDAAWRRRLSRRSDEILRDEATRSDGAIVASFWRLIGMPSDSGTPADWLRDPSHHVVQVHCVCPLEAAADRFVQRRRHPGHLDAAVSYDQVLDGFRELILLAPLDIGRRIDVDTSAEPDLDDVARSVRGALEN
jgi:glucokinase